MANGLEELCSKLSLGVEEEEEVIIECQWVEETLAQGESYLLVKILTRKVVNMEAMRTVSHRVWKLRGNLNVKEVREKLFIFKFEKSIEKDRMLLQQPWSFNKALLVLSEFDGFSCLTDVEMARCDFWVQVHGLPLGFVNEWVGHAIGQVIGQVIIVEKCGDQAA